MGLVERGAEVRSFQAPSAIGETVDQVLRAHIEPSSHLMTDEAKHFRKIGRTFQQYSALNPTGKEYVRGVAYTDAIEGVFGMVKCGMKGVYQYCGNNSLTAT